MSCFCVGDRVVIRYGRQQGQNAQIIQSSKPDVFKVKTDDGSVLFFSGKGLEKQEDARLRATLKPGEQPPAAAVPPRFAPAPLPVVKPARRPFYFGKLDS